MKKLIASIVAFCAAATANCQLPTANSSTYKNPILPVDFSDPDVTIGHDGRAYMTASSFGGLPGLPILVSEDLVHWRYLAYALEKHPFYTHSPEHGNAVWAPSIRYRADKGEYVIYWGDPDRGAYRISAKDPSGPWSEPVLVKSGKGIIDVCPLYDDDGSIYIVHGWAQSRAKMNSVLTVSRLNAEETECIEDETLVYDGIPDGNFTAEGPKFYKRGGEYWLLFPAGGVGGGWQVAARSDTPYGPFTAKTVMAQGNTKINGPHQGGWVHTPAGEDWFIHFSDRDAYGRIVYLEPMKWLENGWPVIGVDPDGDGCGEPVEEFAAPAGYCEGAKTIFDQASDEFDTNRIGLQWQFLGKRSGQVAFPTKAGYLRLYSTQVRESGKLSSFSSSFSIGNTWNMPNLFVQKFPAFDFTATMKAKAGAKQSGEEAGIIIQGRSYARLGLRLAGEEFEIVYTKCIGADKGKNEETSVIGRVPAVKIGAGIRAAYVKDVFLRVTVKAGEIPPKELGPQAVCTFEYSFDGEKWNRCPETFTASPGKWIGATVGAYAIAPAGCNDRGWLDIDYFRF